VWRGDSGTYFYVRPKHARVRLDTLLVERGLVESREKGRRLLMAGEVRVNGQTADKPGTLVAADAAIELKAGPRFASRGGDKLDAALESFQVNVAGWVCADVGASTGGFTDCLLQRGAAQVYAIDVGEGILDWRLRNDLRVIVMENINARYVEHLPERVRLVTIDASFISLKILLPVAQGWLEANGEIVALIKPQFEAGRDRVGKKGVVRDPQVHCEVLNEILTFAEARNLHTAGLIRSPLLGPAGNVEFLARLSTARAEANVEALVARVLASDSSLN
jgi:23S rRNA (cytidine1920-2'-O)/16S rRNA (cytidine1409-2'-O)-methyltransferase